MKGTDIFRLTCIALLWALLCALLLATRGLDGQACLAIVMSGIIVFVPLYKKYIRRDK